MVFRIQIYIFLKQQRLEKELKKDKQIYVDKISTNSKTKHFFSFNKKFSITATENYLGILYVT